jgi:hypothetical protein
VSGKRLDVGSISGEDRAAWLGDRDDHTIGTSTCSPMAHMAHVPRGEEPAPTGRSKPPRQERRPQIEWRRFSVGSSESPIPAFSHIRVGPREVATAARRGPGTPETS